MNKFDAHIYGPFFSASGVGESTRAYWQTLSASGLNVGIIPQNSPFNEMESIIAKQFNKYLVDRPHPEHNFFRINAQEIASTPQELLKKQNQNQKNYLIPMWETSRVPVKWREDIASFDQIIAATEFIANSFATLQLDIPIHVSPHAIILQESIRIPIRSLGLPDDRRYHLYSFSYASYISRKNPLALLELKQMFAKHQNFGSDVFVLASSDLPRNQDDINAHRLLLESQDLNFIYLSGGRSREMQLSLIGNANSFISLHKAEGIGLQLAEAMILGTPVITHTYSGPADFVYSDDPGVYPFRMQNIGKNEYPYSSGQQWAGFSMETVYQTLVSTLRNDYDFSFMRNRISDHFSLNLTSKRILKIVTGSC